METHAAKIKYSKEVTQATFVVVYMLLKGSIWSTIVVGGPNFISKITF